MCFGQQCCRAISFISEQPSIVSCFNSEIKGSTCMCYGNSWKLLTALCWHLHAWLYVWCFVFGFRFNLGQMLFPLSSVYFHLIWPQSSRPLMLFRHHLVTYVFISSWMRFHCDLRGVWGKSQFVLILTCICSAVRRTLEKKKFILASFVVLTVYSPNTII